MPPADLPPCKAHSPKEPKGRSISPRLTFLLHPHGWIEPQPDWAAALLLPHTQAGVTALGKAFPRHRADPPSSLWAKIFWGWCWEQAGNSLPTASCHVIQEEPRQSVWVYIYCGDTRRTRLASEAADAGFIPSLFASDWHKCRELLVENCLQALGLIQTPTEDKGKTWDCLGAGLGSVPLSLPRLQHTDKADGFWGMVSLCLEAHPHTGQGETAKHIKAFPKFPVQRLPGRGGWELCAATSRHSALVKLAPRFLWLGSVSIMLKLLSQNLNCVVYLQAECFNPTNTIGLGTPTLSTPVCPKWHKPHWAFLFFHQGPKYLHLQTPCHLKYTKPFVLSTIKQQFAFFLIKRQPAELKNGMTSFHSASLGHILSPRVL